MAHKRNNNNRAGRSWANMLEDVLFKISMRLSVVEYLAFGGVCKSWRSVAVVHKEQFMATQPPLILILSTRAVKFCSFFSIFDAKRFKCHFPDLTGRFCWGFSSGYLIMQDRYRKVWSVNPITRQELHFVSFCHLHRRPFNSSYRSILAYSKMLSDFVMVVFCKCCNVLRFCRPDEDEWAIYSCDRRTVIVDLAFFRGKIYVLTNNARIGVFKLGPQPSLTFLDVNGTPNLCSAKLQLVPSNQHLFMVNFRPKRETGIYKLHCGGQNWEKIESLGDEALFISSKTICSAVKNPIKWGGRANCIYYLRGRFCYIYSLDGREIDRLFFLKGPEKRIPNYDLVWYFSDQCYSNNVMDNDT